MAAIAPNQATTTSVDGGNNQFKLSDRHGTTQIVYNLTTPGPLTVGETVSGPQMHYEGEEGTYTFSTDQIQQEVSPIGTLVTVTLNIVPDSRILMFTLVLPDVKDGAGQSSQRFETLGIKTSKHTTLIGPAMSGADKTYSVLHLEGIASRVAIPM